MEINNVNNSNNVVLQPLSNVRGVVVGGGRGRGGGGGGGRGGRGDRGGRGGRGGM